jgi:hypothetical protein
LAPGQWVSVTVNATTPPGCGPYALATEAKQSNDFSGPPGNDLTLAGTQPSINVNPGSTVASLVWTTQPATSQRAGQPFSAQVTAYDACWNPMVNYSGPLNFSGLGTSPSATGPVYGTVTWSNGVASISGVEDFKSETTSLVASIGAIQATSTAFTVAPGPLASFSWTSQPGASQTAGKSFGAQLTALDTWGNVKTDYAGSNSFGLSGLGTSPTPSSTPPSYSNSWSSGVDSVTATDYKTETASLVAADGGVQSQNSSVFTVVPGALASFSWTSEPGPNQKAGMSFGAHATAYDTWSNIKTDYNGGTLTGLGTSPNGTPPSYSDSWSAGIDAVSVTDYTAETTSLTLTDGAVQASTTSFIVAPGDLNSFSWTGPGSAQTAGGAFGATLTATDTWGNVKTDYAGGNSFGLSGLGTSPNLTGPTYGATSWSNGVATVVGIKDYKAETTNLVATDGGVHGTSGSFTVSPGLLASLSWTRQPTETQKATPIAPSPAVIGTDSWGNPIAGAVVTASLAPPISGTGTLSGTPTATTLASGVATFGNLAVSDVGEYQLVATSGAVSGTSAAFVIANQVTPCNGSCSGTGAIKNNTTTNATATNAPSGTSLAVSVIGNDSVSPGVCGGFGFAQLGAGSFVNIVSNSNQGTPTPNFTITWTLDKSLVQAAGNPGASHFDICLGAENLLDPMGTHTTPWTTKLNTPAQAVPDLALGVTLFWGIVPDCPSPNNGPCVQSKHKDNAGDEVITFLKPSPWDGHYYGGGP